jgi:sortase A
MPPCAPRHSTRRGPWRPGPLLLLTAAVAVVGATILAYSPAASWLSAYNQSLVVGRYTDSIQRASPPPSEQLAAARAYNADLSAGAVLEADSNVPTGKGKSRPGASDYWTLLDTPDRAMARIQIPKIGVDLPIYHGTSDAVLRKGAGHLRGTSLPVGGRSTHAVITAHRGLAEATMFTDLDKLERGDRFVVTTFGEVLAYRVVDTRVVEPEDTATLRQEPGRDLVTLVTCTPLGINTHRILVTGSRISPTPQADRQVGEKAAAGLAFPWWAVLYLGGLLLIGLYVWRAGRTRWPRRAHEAVDRAE